MIFTDPLKHKIANKTTWRMSSPNPPQLCARYLESLPTVTNIFLP